MARTRTKNQKKKAVTRRGGGLMAEMAAAFAGTNQKLLKEACANAEPLGDFSNWEPEEGDYVLRLRPHPASSARLIEPDDDDAYTVFSLALTIESAPPNYQDTIDEEFEHAFFMRPIKSKKTGQMMIPAARELKTIVQLVQGSDGIPSDPVELCALVASFDGAFDVRVKDARNSSGEIISRKDGSPIKNYTWRSLVEE